MKITDSQSEETLEIQRFQGFYFYNTNMARVLL